MAVKTNSYGKEKAEQVIERREKLNRVLMEHFDILAGGKVTAEELKIAESLKNEARVIIKNDDLMLAYLKDWDTVVLVFDKIEGRKGRRA